MTRLHRQGTAFALALVAALAAWFAPEHPGYQLNGDVTAYLGSASSLVNEGRLRHPLGTIFHETTDSPLAHWPPGYPLAIAAPMALGAPAIEAARLVKAIGAFVSVIVLVSLVWSLAGPIAAALAAAIAVVTPSIVGVYLSPLSEAFFTSLVVLLVYAMVRWPRHPLRYGLVAAAVVITRYVGVAFAAAACIWALLQRGTPRERLGRALVAGLPTLVTQLAWLAWTRSVSGDIRRLGLQAPPGETIRRLVGGVSRWLAPGLSDAPYVPFVKLIVVLALLGLVAYATIVLWRRWRTDDDPRAAQSLALFSITATFTLLYYVVYVLARLYADYALDFHPRYWAPLELLFAAVVAISLVTWWRSGRATPGFAAAGIAAAWWAAALVSSVELVRTARVEQAASVASFARSPMLAWVRAEAGGRELFSNWGAVLYRYLGRSSRELPIVDDPALDSLLGRRLRASNGLIVNFTDRDPIWMLPPGARYIDPDSLAARQGMVVVARFPEGKIYALPADHGAMPESRAARSSLSALDH